MEINYFRSSSYTKWDFCPHCYFAEYVLGIRPPSNLKAELGTIVHKILEILANISLAKIAGDKIFKDEDIGGINVSTYDVNKLTRQVYDYYKKNSIHHYIPSNSIFCKDSVKKVLDFNNGQFDPRKLKVIKAEQKFDFEIEKPWATLTGDEDGSGKFLSIKGTIDLITQPSYNMLEIIDWKTGKRLDWATGKEKDYEYLKTDSQLCMYHYAAHHLYPDVENIMITIYFINDGGPFSIPFSKNDLPRTEQILQRRFETIKRCQQPILNKSWKCSKLCHFGKTSFDKPYIEFRKNQTQDVGEPMTKCEQLSFEIRTKGIEKTIQTYKTKGFDIGAYVDPGAVSGTDGHSGV